MASDLDKPDGLVIVAAGSERDLLRPMHVTVIPGVGPATAERLRRAEQATRRAHAAKRRADVHHPLRVRLDACHREQRGRSLPERALGFCQLFRNRDLRDHIKIAAPTAAKLITSAMTGCA